MDQRIRNTINEEFLNSSLMFLVEEVEEDAIEVVGEFSKRLKI